MKLLAVFLTVLMLGGVVVSTAAAEVNVKLEVAADGLTAPLNMVVPPDGTKRRFITMFRSTWNRALPTDSPNQSTRLS